MKDKPELIKLEQFRQEFFATDQAPQARTLRKSIDDGELPGGIRVGGAYYINRSLWLSLVNDSITLLI